MAVLNAHGVSHADNPKAEHDPRQFRRYARVDDQGVIIAFIDWDASVPELSDKRHIDITHLVPSDDQTIAAYATAQFSQRS